MCKYPRSGAKRSLAGSLLACFVAASAGSWVGCETKTTAVAPDEPVAVTVSVPLEREILDYEEFTGRTAPVDSVDIRARVNGHLTKILFQDGMEVKQGQPLFEIDARPYELALKSAQGQLATLKARLVRCKADFARAEQLLPNHAISPTDYDKIAAEMAETEASLQSAAAAADHADLDLQFTKIAAPIDGRISRTLITVGNLVAADSTLLTNIVSVDPIYAYFDVDEHRLLMIQQSVRDGKIKVKERSQIDIYLGLATEQGYPHQGTLDFAENRVDPSTGTIQLRGVFANPRPERGDRMLLPGLFVRIRVPLADPHAALFVSEKALGTDQGQKYVLVVDAKKKEVVYRAVEIGRLEAGLRVIKKGLQPGEQVIVTGLQRVRPGSPVTAKLVAMESFSTKGLGIRD